MSAQIKNKVDGIVSTIELPEGVDRERITQILSAYIATEESVFEAIAIEMDDDGKIVGGETEKWENLKFRFGELVVEMIKSGGALYGVKTTPLLWIPIIVDFTKKAKELSTLEFGSKEAQILLALYQLDLEDDPLSIDTLYDLTDGKLTDQELQQSLLELQRLGCLTLEIDRIVLNETLDL